MEKVIFNGPAEFEMKVFITNDETDQHGRATITLGALEYPSKERIRDRIAKFEKEELNGALEGFRLMTKREAAEFIIFEKTCERMAIAGSPDWDEI